MLAAAEDWNCVLLIWSRKLFSSLLHFASYYLRSLTDISRSDYSVCALDREVNQKVAVTLFQLSEVS
jgi:hypothetical protein